MYQKFWEPLFIAKDDLSFWAIAQQYQEENENPFDLIVASSDVVNVSHKDKEETFTSFIQQIHATYPDTLIHILRNKNETFEELLADGNIHFHDWNEVDSLNTVIERLSNKFDIPEAELRKFIRLRMALEKNPTSGQITMDLGILPVELVSKEKENSLIKQQDSSILQENPILKGQISLFDLPTTDKDEKTESPAQNTEQEVHLDTLPNTETDGFQNTIVPNEECNESNENVESIDNKEELTEEDIEKGTEDGGIQEDTGNVYEKQSQPTVKEAQDSKQPMPSHAPGSSSIVRIQDVSSPFDLNDLTRDFIKRVVASGVQTRPNYFQMKSSQAKMVPPKVVAVVNLYDRCGASFITNNFALYLATQNLPVGVLELPQPIPMLYKRLGGDSARPREWESWFASVKANSLQYKPGDGKTFTVPCVKEGLLWKQHQVYWMPINPHSQIEDITDLGYSQLLSIYATAMEIPILLVDVSSNIKSWFSKIIYEYADEVWITVEPEWERIQFYAEHIEFLRDHAGDKLHYICNKSVSNNRTRSDWQKFTKRFKEWIPERPLTTIPLQLELRDLEDNHAFAFLGEAGEDILGPLFEPLMQRIAPIKREQPRSHVLFSPKKWLKYIR